MVFNGFRPGFSMVGIVDFLPVVVLNICLLHWIFCKLVVSSRALITFRFESSFVFCFCKNT